LEKLKLTRTKCHSIARGVFNRELESLTFCQAKLRLFTYRGYFFHYGINILRVS